MLTGGPDALWTDLLGDLDLATAKVDGPWGQMTRDKVVTLWAGHPREFGGRLALPVRPRGDYEVRLAFARTGGDGGLAILLPVADSSGTQVAVVIDGRSAAGGVVALESVNKVPVERPTKQVVGDRLVKDRTYTVVVRVERADGRAAVRATLAEVGAAPKPLLDWTGPVADLTPSANRSTPDRSVVGLGVEDHTRFKITAADVRMLRGTAELLVPPAQPAEKPGQVGRFGRFRGSVLQIALSADGRHVFVGEDGVA
jgi:hypothetical protein